MLKNNCVLTSIRNWKFEISDMDGILNPVKDFNRVTGSSELILQLEFQQPPDSDEIYIHTDLPETQWGRIKFKKNEDPCIYTLSIDLPKGGFFSFRFFMVQGHDAFWEPGDYHRLLVDPDFMHNLRMYTLIPTVSGTIADWTAKLDEISDLGFNAVHILPFTAMGPSQSPYAAADLFKLDPGYRGDEADFELFAQKAADNGIRICFDIVLNHLSDQNELTRTNGHWFISDKERADGLKRAGCWHMNSWISWEDLVLINYDHPAEKIKHDIYEYMLSYVLFWVKKVEKCGAVIRLDNLHSSNMEFIKWFIHRLRKFSPGIIILSEFFGSDEDLIKGVSSLGLNLLTANTWEQPFAPRLQQYFQFIHDSRDTLRYMIQPTSHDTGAAAQLFGTALSSIPRYFCCALMGTGQSGAVQGFENGYPRKVEFIGYQGKVDLSGELDLTDFIKSVNSILSAEPLLRKGGNIKFIETGNDSLIICERTDSKTGRKILLAANFNTNSPQSFSAGHIPEFKLIYALDAQTEYVNEHLIVNLGKCGVAALLIKE